MDRIAKDLSDNFGMKKMDFKILLEMLHFIMSNSIQNCSRRSFYEEQQVSAQAFESTWTNF